MLAIVGIELLTVTTSVQPACLCAGRFIVDLASGSSTVEEHLPHYPKIGGLSPATTASMSTAMTLFLSDWKFFSHFHLK
jgi:hypothetical protein